jgi:hypothetical protein
MRNDATENTIGRIALISSLGLAFAVLVIFSHVAVSQVATGAISGQITDLSGAAVPNAKVTATNIDTSLSVTAISDASGAFIIPHLALGNYSVTISANGFKEYKYPSVAVTVAASSKLDVRLTVGVTEETVTVSAEPLSFGPPTWNVWTEDFESAIPTYKPSHMKADHSSLLVVDLAAFAYDLFEGNGVYSHKVSESFDRWIKANKQKKATVQVLIVPDSRFFERQDTTERVKPLVIDLAKISSAQKSGFKAKASPFPYLAKHRGKAPFDFTDVKASFTVKAKSNVSGSAPVAISLWVEGKPVDELSYIACIDGATVSTCNDAQPNDVLDGVDVSQHNSMPDLALHLVELGSDDIIGVFRCNVCGWKDDEFKTWRLGRSVSWFRAQFVTSVLPNIQRASIGADAAASEPGSNEATLTAQYDEGLLNTTGDHLYSLLFHTEDGGTNEAEAAFREFVANHSHQADPTKPPPSLFVRLLPSAGDQNFIVPLQLARVNVSAQDSVFLGFIFRVQVPLELQDYSSGVGCINQWELLVPPKGLQDNPLSEARDTFSDWIDAFKASKNAVVYEDLQQFESVWLNPKHDEKPGNDVVLMLSHNQGNTIHFDSDDAGIEPDMTRRYATASLVILGACSTANPGAFEFVREFNLHGANSIIASSVDVDARLGGLFLKVLADKLKLNAGKNDYTIDRAVFDTFSDLEKEPDNFPAESKPYGARVLIFNMAGNGNIRVCVPAKP